MKNPEKLATLEPLNEALRKLQNPENSESTITWERIPDICEKASKESTKKACSELNKILWESFEKKWINFIASLQAKVDNPIWLTETV